MGEDHFAVEVFARRFDPHTVGDTGHQRDRVRENQRLDPGLGGDAPSILRLGVRTQDMVEQLLRVPRNRRTGLAAIDPRIAVEGEVRG